MPTWISLWRVCLLTRSVQARLPIQWPCALHDSHSHCSANIWPIVISPHWLPRNLNAYVVTSTSLNSSSWWRFHGNHSHLWLWSVSLKDDVYYWRPVDTRLGEGLMVWGSRALTVVTTSGSCHRVRVILHLGWTCDWGQENVQSRRAQSEGQTRSFQFCLPSFHVDLQWSCCIWKSNGITY